MKWLVISISILCCLAWAGVVSGVDETDTVDAAEVITDEISTYTFIQEGTGGSFVKDDSGNYTLTITEVIPYTIYFSDRPARNAGFAKMDQFIDGFSFDPNNPPNAAVIVQEGEEDTDMVVVELTAPLYDETTGTLTYTAKIIADYTFESEWPQDLLERTDDTIPEVFGQVVIVIDDCPCIPDGDCHSGWRNSCWEWKCVMCEPCGGCC